MSAPRPAVVEPPAAVAPDVAASGAPASRRGNKPVLVAAGLVLAAALVGSGVLLSGVLDGDDAMLASTSEAQEREPSSAPVEEPTDEPEPLAQNEEEPVVEEAEPVVEEVLVPASISATAERSSSDLRCTGQTVSYAVAGLIDGDMDTGWGAGADDGTGQSATVRFDGPVRLTSIGLTPGYAKFGPRQSNGCVPVLAFEYNRWVPLVEYAFDDGSTVLHRFSQSPDLQTKPVDVVTSSVVITVLETVRPPGADDDTVLSEAVFTGSRQ